ncbi:hypothetical protein IPA_03755 [Ignicoccus pacificus DSM 13166]|uniref:DUF2070 domain-containing protein n=1 Tax=Ignicoccus pacificus DSM 13166 TaxID=940294 RepID=A0A977KC08_9CREN|nr:hypothetical protein IPA_03755 [Ignicoccus pacificus DSM 13166]
MEKVIKYYKLLFTLPSERISLALLAFTYLVLCGLKPSILPYLVTEQVVFTSLFYERRILNGRRLAFLYSASNLAAMWKVPLATTFMSIGAMVSLPHPLTPFIANVPLLALDPRSILPLIPLSLAMWYGNSKGIGQLGVAWLRAWMGDEYEKVERVIYESGRDRKARGVALGPILFTDVHFGLMRYSMGTTFPHLLMVNGKVPHRLCGSHENNPATRWENFKVANVMLREFKEGSIKLEEYENEMIEVKEIKGENCVKVIYHKKGADDLPCLEELCEVADPHNNEGPSPSKETLLKELESVKLKGEVECSEAEVCDVEIDGKGLCTANGKLVVLNCGKELKWLLVPGNNMERGNREELKEKGLYEVSTLDDHTCAGFGRKKYDVSHVKSFKIKKCRKVKVFDDRIEVEYKAMGDLIYIPEVQNEIVKTIKVGVAAVALSLILSLI